MSKSYLNKVELRLARLKSICDFCLVIVAWLGEIQNVPKNSDLLQRVIVLSRANF